MNVGESGVVYAFGTGFDMSGQTALKITFTKPDTTTLVKTSGITVGSGALVTTLGTFADKKYVKYTFIAGDVDQAGAWSARVQYTDATQVLISDVGTFTVNA